MIVTAPQKYQVISNGLRKQEVDLAGGMRRTVWDETAPIPTWQFALAAAPTPDPHFALLISSRLAGFSSELRSPVSPPR